MLREQVAQIEQELALGPALGRDEAVIVDGRGEVISGFSPSASGDKEGDEVLGVGGVELEVAAEDADGGGNGAAGEGGEAEEERPHAEEEAASGARGRGLGERG